MKPEAETDAEGASQRKESGELLGRIDVKADLSFLRKNYFGGRPMQKTFVVVPPRTDATEGEMDKHWIAFTGRMEGHPVRVEVTFVGVKRAKAIKIARDTLEPKLGCIYQGTD